MRTLKTLAVVLLWTAPALCAERFELPHLGKLVRVADPQIAPDGSGNVRVGNSFGGSPWKDDRMKAYWEQSPISAAHRIKAPTLVLCNTGDYRVPITQSYKLYHALKDNGSRRGPGGQRKRWAESRATCPAYRIRTH